MASFYMIAGMLLGFVVAALTVTMSGSFLLGVLAYGAAGAVGILAIAAIAVMRADAPRSVPAGKVVPAE